MTGDREGSATFGLPDRLYLVRHGQSTGNLAHAAASAAESELLELETRDMDVPLSDLGRDQAKALGAWLDTQPSEERPTVALTSPYVRAEQTAQIALELCCPTVDVHADERLRDRDLGIFEGLTWRGIQAKYPDLAASRARTGKFYQRPPGGESWTDVLLRLRSVHQTLLHEHAGERVIIFTHDVVVLLFRYLYDGLDEATALDLARNAPVRNASLTTFARSGGRLALVDYNVLPPGLD